MRTVRPYRPGDHESLISFLESALTRLGFEFDLNGKDADLQDLGSSYLGRGSFHVAEVDQQIVGCVGVRELSPGVAELKRLYVDDVHQGRGIGRRLIQLAIEDARRLGFGQIRLDTTPRSLAAIHLFRSLGFSEIERYNSDPFAEIFMELVLA